MGQIPSIRPAREAPEQALLSPPEKILGFLLLERFFAGTPYLEFHVILLRQAVFGGSGPEKMCTQHRISLRSY